MSVFEGLVLPKVIYKTHTDISGDIEVLQRGDVKSLSVNKVTQSLSYNSPNVKRMVWGRLVSLLRQEQPNVKNILILGLGGGTMQSLLSIEFPGVHITSVEIDPEIIDISKRFFDIDKVSNHNIIQGDACRVVIEPEVFDLTTRSFDVVMVDIYIGSDYPDLGKSGNFLAHVRDMTVRGGLVVINRVYLHDHQEDVHIFLENVENFFKDVKTIIVPGKTNADNLIIFGRV